MPNCSPNTIHISRPSAAAAAKAVCAPSCGNLGPTDCCDGITSRPKREKVIEQIKDYVLLMLGAPVLDIELDDQQLDLAVKHALQIIEDYAPRDYFQYYVFNTTPGKSIYEMPPDVGHIRDIFYKQTATGAFQATDLGGSIPVEYFYGSSDFSQGLLYSSTPVWGHMGEWAVAQMYQHMYSRLSSNIGGWEWVGDYKHIKLYPIPCKCHAVIVHYLQKCKDWACVTEAMQYGALAFAKIMLGRIRSKYKNMPGPNGGVQLDGDQLLQEGREEVEKFREYLIIRWGDLLPITLG